MRRFDVCNGDADGLCAVLQWRLAHPEPATLVTGLKRELELLQLGAGRGRRRGAGVRPVDAAQPRGAAAPAAGRRAGALCRPPQGRPGAAARGAAGLHRLQPARVHQPADGPAAAGPVLCLGAGRRLWRQPARAWPTRWPPTSAWARPNVSSCACWARASTTTPMATTPATSTSHRDSCTPAAVAPCRSAAAAARRRHRQRARCPAPGGLAAGIVAADPCRRSRCPLDAAE